jgi:hypothetical protein
MRRLSSEPPQEQQEPQPERTSSMAMMTMRGLKRSNSNISSSNSISSSNVSGCGNGRSGSGSSNRRSSTPALLNTYLCILFGASLLSIVLLTQNLALLKHYKPVYVHRRRCDTNDNGAGMMDATTRADNSDIITASSAKMAPASSSFDDPTTTTTPMMKHAATRKQRLPQNNVLVDDATIAIDATPPHRRTTVKLALIGERNSGTTWTFDHLQQCFNHTLDVQPSLVRFKHWFQEDVDTDSEERLKPTVVVAQFRDPYYWVEAMRQKAYHSPAHVKIKSWKDYVTKPWTMPRLEQDLYYRDMVMRLGLAKNDSDIPCQDHFTYQQINTCTVFPYDNDKYGGGGVDDVDVVVDVDVDRPSNTKANKANKTTQTIRDTVRYEMHQDGPKVGLPYDSILELRRDKIRNFLSLQETMDFVDTIIPVRYETLLQDGTASLIYNIEQATGTKAAPSCHPKEPQKARSKRPLDPDYVNYMTHHVDWETEALIGYCPHPPSSFSSNNNISTAPKTKTKAKATAGHNQNYLRRTPPPTPILKKKKKKKGYN